MIYLRNENLFPLQIILREILIQSEVTSEMIGYATEFEAQTGLRELIKYAVIIVASLPVLIIYPFVQKHFVKGVMIGSLKE